MNKEIKITRTLTSHQRLEAGQLFFHVFPQKAKHLWLLVHNSQEAGRLLFKAIRPKSGYFALLDNRVIGFIGLNTQKRRFTQLNFSMFYQVFGWFGGLWRFVYHRIFMLFFPKVKKEEMQVDYIGVADEARGLGIGTELLRCAFQQAEKEGKQRIILDVVDTNPKARKLYESLGFQVISHHYYGIFTAAAGFRSSFTMSKQIVPY